MNKIKKIGMSPGSLIYTGTDTKFETRFKSIYYNKDKIQEAESIQKITSLGHLNQWLEVFGVHDSELIKSIGLEYQIHSLVLEDVMDISSRVKIEAYENGIFCIFQLLKQDIDKKDILSEQISVFFSNKLLLSFQEDVDDSFEVLRRRMEMENSRIRSRNSDYLFYAIVDYVVDCYYIIADSLTNEISKVEERVHRGLDDKLVIEIYSIRNKLIKFRNYINPLREEISKIRKTDSIFIHDETLIYFRDLEDHLIHLIEITDGQRELLNGIKDLTNSQAALKLNQDIRWLTVLSTITIPIVLLTGIYGMNFRFMPEIEWRYGYLAWWLVTITIIFTLIIYFRRKQLF
ncbi:MAG: magnesium/cobalt transporter CorA [Saprospiraceae bacterium]